MKKIMEHLHARYLMLSRYHAAAAEEIGRTNFTTLLQVSFVTTLLTGLLILLTPLLFPAWQPSPAHFLLVVGSAVFCVVMMYLNSSGQAVSSRVSNGLCLLFIALLFCLIISIDCQHPDSPASFMPIIMLVLPVLFTFRFFILYGEIVLFWVLYLVAVFHVKTLRMAQIDCFNAVVALCVTLVVGQILQTLRAENFMARREYKHQSMTDGLTGIMNKVNCENAVRDYLAARPASEICALLVLDVDDFKRVNDTMGHQEGDRVLGAVGTLLQQSFRSSDILGRIGGDEFMVLMPGLSGIDIIKRKCEKLSAGIAELGVNMGKPLTCSIGAALLTDEGVDYDQLFREADDALYEAKATGKARVAIHSVLQQQRPAGDRPLLLVADDNAVNRTILRATLQDEYEILEADGGAAALEQVSRYGEQLDLILLDLIMPDVNGYDILKYLKGRIRLAGIPVVVITADNRSELDVLQLGAADMIAKPFDAEVVQLRVRNALRHSCKSADHSAAQWQPRVASCKVADD